MRRRVLFLAAAVLAAGLVLSVAASGAGLLQALHFARQQATIVASLPTAQPTPCPAAQVPASDTLGALASAVVPARDSRALAERLRPAAAPIPEVVNAAPPKLATGDRAQFYVSNSDTRQVFPVTATLRLISQHTEMWVQDGIQVDQTGLERAAKDFDERIYPTVHQYFGSEWTPGVDNDPRITILNARFSGAAGYYSSHDEFSRQVNPYSNEREMFYMNADAATPGSERYLAILAHEFQHMVHWHLDSNEESWVNEGASELAARLCGLGTSGAVQSFAQQPDTQLNAWSLSPDEDTLPHYGASYLWMEYFLQRMGPAALKAVLEEPENGIAGFEKVLSQRAGAPTFDDLFADWVVANLLNDRSLEQGRYAYQQAAPHVVVQETQRELPVHESGTVNQYGTRYIAIAPRTQGITIEFSGSPSTAVVPNQPAQGHYEWWSNRGDMSDTRLTRSFDLTGVQKATLEYSLWYELEDGWDYAYVEVSTDGGTTWKPLSTAHTSDYNPNGNAFGPGYTGFSGHPAGAATRLAPEWVRETVDLTPYAGKPIQIRFEMVTDDAVNLPGLCLDDIAVPELGFSDDAETAAAGWQAEGFVRIDNRLPQTFLVQVIEQGKATRIERLPLDAQQHGTLAIDGFGQDLDRVVLAISGLTRYTTEPATFSYTITPTGPAR